MSYDGNCNQIVRKTAQGVIDRRLRYDIHNRPVWVRNHHVESEYRAGDVEFRYAPSGERYLQRAYPYSCSGGFSTECSAAELTVYPFDGYELTATLSLNSGATDVTWTGTRQHLGGYGIRVSEAGATAPRQIWMHTDRLGSSVAKTTREGTLVVGISGRVERHGYDAYGKPRTGTWQDNPGNPLWPGANGLLSSVVTPRGFTMHEHIDLHKLIHMNGRMFDPLLGRFLGVDPIIQFPTNSQSLNPYSYILNNPMAGTDPTGYMIEPSVVVDCRQIFCMPDLERFIFDGQDPNGGQSAGGANNGASTRLGPDANNRNAVGNENNPALSVDAVVERAFALTMGSPSLSTVVVEGYTPGEHRALTFGQAMRLNFDRNIDRLPLIGEGGKEILHFLLGPLNEVMAQVAEGNYTGATIMAGAALVTRGAVGGTITKTDRLKNHILNGELDAARREAAGQVVARRADGIPWNHVHELRDAQRGLLNRIDSIKRQLSRDNISNAQRTALQRELSEASRLLDRTEGYLPR